MILYIESASGDVMLSGKVSSIGQLKHRMAKTLREVAPQDFVPVFCARYQFDRVFYDSAVPWDYWLDLDTGLVRAAKNETNSI